MDPDEFVDLDADFRRDERAEREQVRTDWRRRHPNAAPNLDRHDEDYWGDPYEPRDPKHPRHHEIYSDLADR